MALPKLYNLITWHNETTPAINEDNLNAMSKAIDDIDDRVIELGDTIMEDVPQIIEALDDLDEVIDTVQGYATTAENAATTATNKAGEASASATTASDKAGEAAASATTASNKAGEAAASATTASNKADAASSSATSAANQALKAEGYAVGEQNGSAASSGSPYYHNNAEYYSDQALGSASAAAASATEAASWSAHPPYIGANGNWYVWDTSDSQYEDSGIDASITITVGTIQMLAYGSTPEVTNSGTSTDAVFNFKLPISAGVKSVVKTGTSGLVDSYRMTFDDNSYFDYTVTNGQDGIDGTDGDDGYSPVVIITSITGGHTVTITDAAHQSPGQSFNVMDGVDGQNGEDGQDGADGVSPKVTISPITGGHRVTITDEDHPTGQSFDVMDGSGSGDMLAAIYDPDGDVATAGGIVQYIDDVITAALTASY